MPSHDDQYAVLVLEDPDTETELNSRLPLSKSDHVSHSDKGGPQDATVWARGCGGENGDSFRTKTCI